MKTTGFLFLAAIAAASPVQGSETVTVRNNLGGVREDFDAQARAWQKAGTKIRLAGSCASACTMFIMTKYGLDVCATPGTRLQFHMPYDQLAQGGNWITDTSAQAKQKNKRSWANDWLGQFNPKLNAVLAKATRNGVIPNPSTEDQGYEGQFSASRFYSVKATDFIPTCE